MDGGPGAAPQPEGSSPGRGPIEVRPPSSVDAGAAVLARVRDRLAGDRSLPLRDVAFETHLPREELARLFAAAGRMRDDDRYGRDDLDYARDLAELRRRFEPEVLQRALRLHQRAATTVAVNQLAVLRGDPRINPLLAADTELPPEVVDLIVDEAEFLLPVTQRLIARDHKEALLRLLDTDVVAAASRSEDTITLAVGFVDLVGFTRLSATVDPSAVGGVLGGFEDAVHQAAEDVDDVLVVKFIGDAAMLVSGEVDRIVDVCLRVVDEPFVAGDEVERRAGVSHGGVEIRDGDYVGTPVNTAARLTDLARPSTVVVDGGARPSLGDDWDVSVLPKRTLKGLGKARHLRVRRPVDRPTEGPRQR